MSKYGLGLALMYALYFCFYLLIVKPLKKQDRLSNTQAEALSMAFLYLPCLYVLWLMIRDVPKLEATTLEWSTGQYVLIFFALFFTTLIMTVTALIEAKVRGISIEELNEDNGTAFNKPLDYLTSLLLAPIMEELFARKFIFDRLAGESLMLFILFSAFCFGMIHFITGKLMVVLGMFYLGFMLSLVYAASGAIYLPILYHALFNLSVVLIPELLIKHDKEKQAIIFRLLLLISGITGFVLFLIKRDELLPADLWTQTGAVWKMIFANPGSWILIIVMLVIYIYRLVKAKTQPQPTLKEDL